ncbi:N5-carboxyaminoimidazole ribonucleotide mutase [Gammaproteobacteria bacterium]
MNDTFVAVLMGSDSDLPTVQGTIDVLDQFGITCEIKITSAHRTPTATITYIQDAEARGCAVFICAAGLAAHLAGTVAAQTIRPVIGIPMESGPLNGIDALLSTVQMPGGIPVACMSIGRAGARNAGYLAAQIISLFDSELVARLRADRESSATAVFAKDADLRRRRG